MSFGFGFALPAYPLRGGGGNNPFNQDGATLDLSFIGTAGDLSGADTYTLNTDFITPEYQVAAQYAVWEDGVGLAQKTFAQIVTFTRASTATYFNSVGTLTSAAINEARFDYNPSTLVPLGFLIEESRTNSIRNNTMQGAVAGTPGTLPTNWSVAAPAANVIGTGTENGITYIDVQVVGTTGATTGNVAFDTITAIAAASGQTWTNSVYIRLVAGSFTNVSQVRVNMQGYTSASAANADAFSSSDIISSLSATNIANNRRTLTATLADATTAYIRPRLFINWTNGAAVDFTLRIGLPQLEQGAFATSVIPTTTTALTRSADVASVNTLSPWYNATEGSIYFEASSFTVNSYPFSLFGSSTQNRIFANYTSLDRMQAGTRESGNFSLASTAAGTAPLNTVGKGALSYKVNDGALSWNGAVAIALSPLPTALPTILRLDIGNNGSLAGNWLNGYLRRITYYPRRLSNAELQSITA